MHQAWSIYKGYAIGKREGYIELVGREQDELTLVVRQAAKQRAKFVAVWQVEECRRLVEKYHGGILSQGTSNHNPLALTIRECFNHALSKVLDTCNTHRALYDYPIIIGQAAEPIGIWRASYCNKVIGTKRLNINTLGIDKCYKTSKLTNINIGNTLAVNKNLTLGNITKLRHSTQQGTLTRTIAAKQRNHSTTLKSCCDTTNESSLSKGECYVI